MNERVIPCEEALPRAALPPELARGVLDALPHPIFVLDPKDRVLLRNLAHKRLLARLGLTALEQLDMNQGAELFDDAEGFRAFVRGAQEEREVEHEARFRLLSSGRTLSISMAPVRLPEAGTVARLVILREEAADATLAKTVTELRTPLTAIRGFVELVAHREYDEPTRRKHLEVALEQCDRLGRMLEDLLREPAERS